MAIKAKVNRISKIAFIVLIILLILILSPYIWGYLFAKIYPYTAGKTGIHCYETENPHGNIKYHIFFRSKQACLDTGRTLAE